MTTTATTLILLVLTMSTFISSSTFPTNPTTQDITVATQEMQKANYFTFVMLINMAPHHTFTDQQSNGITFFMPNDKTLSKTDMSQSSVLDFLLRHSIPSPLLIDHLEHFPTGSTIPTSKPGFVFRVANNGRRGIFLSNVRVISPNICTKGAFIRCHGIDGVVQPEIIPPTNLPPTIPPTCSNSSGRWPGGPPPPANGTIIASGPPSVVEVSHPKSGSDQIIGRVRVFDLVMTIFMLGVVGLLLWL